MFSGIIEQLATVEDIIPSGSGLEFVFSANIVDELKIDQSVAHNGVCLTVCHISENKYHVVAIKETLDKTNLGKLKVGNKVNLERCIRLSDRLDGHIVQGHVDGTATVHQIEDVDGSWLFSFVLNPDFISIDGVEPQKLMIQKGSITINGTSLTLVSAKDKHFKVAIIPYTYEHTNFHTLKIGDTVNIELDILGKYLAKLNG
jgi:riboflavin synthase